jgi:hypothetical protein
MTIKTIDNFFDTPTLVELKSIIKHEIANNECELHYIEPEHANDSKIIKQIGSEIAEFNGQVENDHYGFYNSTYYMLTGESRTFWLKNLVSRNVLSKDILDTMDCMVRYHENHAPYGGDWHLDSTYEKDNSIDYVGVTHFLHDAWNINDGGLFLYKENKEDTHGKFIEPTPNRIIINYTDHIHAVSTVVAKKGIVRLSVQMFINHKYLI